MIVISTATCTIEHIHQEGCNPEMADMMLYFAFKVSVPPPLPIQNRVLEYIRHLYAV